jgi:ribosome maturation factor RimP
MTCAKLMSAVGHGVSPKEIFSQGNPMAQCSRERHASNCSCVTIWPNSSSPLGYSEKWELQKSPLFLLGVLTPNGRGFFQRRHFMAHPLVPQVIELAAPIATDIGLEVVDAVFQTNQSPPVLRIDVRNPNQEDTGLDDCARLSVALTEALDESNLIPDAYVLEVSSPGVSDVLTRDRDFAVFKGFPVEVQLSEVYKKKQVWQGSLVGRDEVKVSLNLKGRLVGLPRELVCSVQLSQEEDAAP